MPGLKARLIIKIPLALDTILTTTFIINFFHIFTFAERGLPAKALYGSSSSLGGIARLHFLGLLRSIEERGISALHCRMFISVIPFILFTLLL
jgi:hypothetical protein